MKWWQKPAPCWIVCVLGVIILAQFVVWGYEHRWNQQQQAQIHRNEKMPAELAIQVDRLSELIGELQKMKMENHQEVNIGGEVQRMRNQNVRDLLELDNGETDEQTEW